MVGLLWYIHPISKKEKEALAKLNEELKEMYARFQERVGKEPIKLEIGSKVPYTDEVFEIALVKVRNEKLTPWHFIMY